MLAVSFSYSISSSPLVMHCILHTGSFTKKSLFSNEMEHLQMENINIDWNYNQNTWFFPYKLLKWNKLALWRLKALYTIRNRKM